MPITHALCAIAHCVGCCCFCARMVENMSYDTFSPAMGYGRIASLCYQQAEKKEESGLSKG